MTESPRPIPCPARAAAIWSERSTNSAKLQEARLPSSSRITKPGASFPRANSSNQSSAKLKWSPTSGQANSATASPYYVRWSISLSRTIRSSPVPVMSASWQEDEPDHTPIFGVSRCERHRLRPWLLSGLFLVGRRLWIDGLYRIGWFDWLHRLIGLGGLSRISCFGRLAGFSLGWLAVA